VSRMLWGWAPCRRWTDPAAGCAAAASPTACDSVGEAREGRAEWRVQAGSVDSGRGSHSVAGVSWARLYPAPSVSVPEPLANCGGRVVVEDSSVARPRANPPAPPATKAATTSNVERERSASLTGRVWRSSSHQRSCMKTADGACRWRRVKEPPLCSGGADGGPGGRGAPTGRDQVGGMALSACGPV
jgi:hypothetical protein